MSEPLPIGCAARYGEIKRRAWHLQENFVNGNRNDTYQELKDMEPGAALAVLSLMIKLSNHEVVEDITRYLMEVA